MQRRKGSDFHTFIHSFWGACLGGILIALLGGVALLMILALIGTVMETPSRVILPFGFLALGVAMLLSGWTSVRLWGHDTPIPALLSGALLAVILVAVGLCFGGSTLPLGVRLCGAPIGVLLALLGGLLGGKKPKKHRRRS